MSADRDTVSTTSTGDFNVYGEISGNVFIGTNVGNQNNEIVGKIEDVYIEGRGAMTWQRAPLCVGTMPAPASGLCQRN